MILSLSELSEYSAVVSSVKTLSLDMSKGIISLLCSLRNGKDFAGLPQTLV